MTNLEGRTRGYAIVRTKLFKRARADQVKYGDKIAYPDDARLMLDAVSELDAANERCNELYRMLVLLRENDGECLGDHKDWIAGIDKLLDGDSFDAFTLRKAGMEP